MLYLITMIYQINKDLFTSSNLYLFCIGSLSHDKYTAVGFFNKKPNLPPNVLNIFQMTII